MKTRWIATGCTLLLLAFLPACGKVSTQSPPEHAERLEKAAGVARFSLTSAKDLWEHTRDIHRSGGKASKEVLDDVRTKRAPGEAGERGLVTVTLTGTQLVEYLRRLDHDAHPGDWDHDPDPIAVRTYDAIAPVIDAIKPGARAQEMPSVVLDDAVPVPAASPTDA